MRCRVRESRISEIIIVRETASCMELYLQHARLNCPLDREAARLTWSLASPAVRSIGQGRHTPQAQPLPLPHSL